MSHSPWTAHSRLNLTHAAHGAEIDRDAQCTLMTSHLILSGHYEGNEGPQGGWDGSQACSDVHLPSAL